MIGRQLRADTRLAGGHDGEEEPDDVDAFVVEVPRHVLRQLRVEQHHGHDRAVAGLDDESRVDQPLAPELRVGFQLVAPLGAGAEQVDHGDGRRRDGRRHGIAEQVGPRPLAAQLHDLLAPRHAAAARAAERFAERRRDDVDLPHHAEMFVAAPAGFPDETRRVAVVQEHQRVVLLGQGADLVHRRQVAVHAEDAVGDDDANAPVLVFLKFLLQVRHVAVFVGVVHRLRQADPVDDAGVDQTVGDHDVVRAEDGFEDAGVGIEAAREEDGVFGAEELGQLALEFAVHVLRAADEPDARHAVAAFVEGFVRRGHDGGMARQPQIVVGAEVDDLFQRGSARELDADVRRLRRVDVPLFLEDPLLADAGQFTQPDFFGGCRVCHVMPPSSPGACSPAS